MAKPNTCRKLCIHLPQSSYFIINWVLTSHYIFSWCCDQCIMWPSSGAVSSGALRLSLLPAMICLSFIPVPASLAYQGWYTSASSSGLHCDGSSHMTSKKATSFSYRRPTRPLPPEKKTPDQELSPSVSSHLFHLTAFTDTRHEPSTQMSTGENNKRNTVPAFKLLPIW